MTTMTTKKYALIDTANCFFRSRHVAQRTSDTDLKLGMALHLTLTSINHVVRKFGIDHVVFALEGRSWRKDFYKPYKANRAVARAQMSVAEAEEDQLFWQTYEKFTEFLTTKTNCSVIRDANAEADDIIARFIDLHPHDQHVIISSDTDFYQLLSENVRQYNGIANQLLTVDGIYDDKDQAVIDKKTNQPKTLGDPEFVLFEKIMRGDSSDNVFSAYPGVRTRGTKNRVGLTEAFADRHRAGFAFNNIMLQRWVDHNGLEHTVRDDFERNRILIDLRAQPPEIKQQIDQTITTTLKTQSVPQVGTHFIRFCAKYELNKISDNINQYVSWLNKCYTVKETQHE